MVLADLLSILPKRYRSNRTATQQVVSFAVVSALLVTLLIACAPAEDQAPTVYRLPWLDANGNYSFQDIELKTFHDPDNLRGSVGEVVVDPRLSSNSIDASEPIGRWIRDGSRMRPSDFVTQQAATLYAHIERLSEIDQATGVSAKLKGISRIGLLVRVAESFSSPMILNNAIYDGKLDALFIVPYAGELLPISQNGGIIGHEHFHRIFQATVMLSLREVARNGAIDIESACAGAIVEKTEEPTFPYVDSVGGIVPMKVLNQTLLRGVNEGFADFWGWAYTQDDNFVARSLGAREDVARRLDRPISMLPQKAEFRNSLVTVGKGGGPVLKSDGALVASSYRIGTEYARVLRGVVEALVAKGMMSRAVAVEKVRAALASSLETLSEEVSATWKREEIEPEMMLKPFFTKLIRMSNTGPAVLEAASATVACEELVRLKASVRMLSGLCDAKAGMKSPSLSP